MSYMSSILHVSHLHPEMTSFTTSREQAGLQRGRQSSAEQEYGLCRLTIELPGPGRAILINKVEV